MRHDYSDALPEGFYMPDGRVNFSSIVTHEHHLAALAVAERNIYSIAEHNKGISDANDEAKHKADAAHKYWTWLRARIRQRLAVFKARQKSIKLSRSILIRKYLVQELKKHVPHAVYKECEQVARELARKEAGNETSPQKSPDESSAE